MNHTRTAVSLAEVLIALSVMTIVFVPIMFTFLTSAGGAGQDVREVRAAMMAEEILEQVLAVHRNLPDLAAVPCDNAPGSEKEIDLDETAKRCPGEEGFSLWLGKGASQCSRMVLSPARAGFTRHLSILDERVGKNRGLFLMTPALFRVTARVRFMTPVAGGEVNKDVKLQTFLSTDAVHLEDCGE